MLSFPLEHSDSRWAHLFESLPDDPCDEAACVWFEQWADLTTSYDETRTEIIAAMPAWHALSNRVEVPFSKVIDMIDSPHWKGKTNYYAARVPLISALTCRGWEGIAMRAWTDPRGYMGLLQWLNQGKRVVETLDDMAVLPQYSSVFSNAINKFPVEGLQLPWVVATCLRNAAWGVKGTEVPSLFTALQTVCADAALWNSLADPDFKVHPGIPKELIEHWVNDPRIWLHMSLMENSWYLAGSWRQSATQTQRLWLALAMAVEHPFVKAWNLISDQEPKIHEAMYGTTSNEMEMAAQLDLAAFCRERVETLPAEVVGLPELSV